MYYRPEEVKTQRIADADTLVVAYCQLITESQSIMVRLDLLPKLESAIADLRAVVES